MWWCRVCPLAFTLAWVSLTRTCQLAKPTSAIEQIPQGISEVIYAPPLSVLLVCWMRLHFQRAIENNGEFLLLRRNEIWLGRTSHCSHNTNERSTGRREEKRREDVHITTLHLTNTIRIKHLPLDSRCSLDFLARSDSSRFGPGAPTIQSNSPIV